MEQRGVNCIIENTNKGQFCTAPSCCPIGVLDGGPSTQFKSHNVPMVIR